MEKLLKNMMKMMNVEELDEETTRMVERMVVLRVATKHINLWMRQLEMKRNEIRKLAGLIGFEVVKEEIGDERNLERWAKKSTHHFTKMVKRTLF